MSKKVFIGVGHGGADSGAVGLKGIKEKDLNLSIALSARAELERHGVAVLMSRYRDENDPLMDEIKECNRFAPDLAIDFHNNAGGGDGFEAYHYRKGGTSKTLALNIESEVKAIGQNSRGCKVRLDKSGADYFGFIRQTNAPAVLCEFAFVDSKDVAAIDTADKQKAMGIAAAKGILKTLGIAWKSPKKKYKLEIFSFIKKEDADKVKQALNLLGCYAETQPHVDGKYKVVSFTYTSLERAKDVQAGLKLIDNVYSEIREM